MVKSILYDFFTSELTEEMKEVKLRLLRQERFEYRKAIYKLEEKINKVNQEIEKIVNELN